MGGDLGDMDVGGLEGVGGAGISVGWEFLGGWGGVWGRYEGVEEGSVQLVKSLEGALGG